MFCYTSIHGIIHLVDASFSHWCNPTTYLMLCFCPSHHLKYKTYNFFHCQLHCKFHSSHSFVCFFSKSFFLSKHLHLTRIQHLQSSLKYPTKLPTFFYWFPTMEYHLTSLLVLASTVSAAIVPVSSPVVAADPAAGTPVVITPHPFYSSSIGVLGCMINTNRGM